MNPLETILQFFKSQPPFMRQRIADALFDQSFEDIFDADKKMEALLSSKVEGLVEIINVRSTFDLILKPWEVDVDEVTGNSKSGVARGKKLSRCGEDPVLTRRAQQAAWIMSAERWAALRENGLSELDMSAWDGWAHRSGYYRE